MNTRTTLIVASLTIALLAGIVYWTTPRATRCPANIPIGLTGNTEAIWGELTNPYFSARFTETQGRCTVDEELIPSVNLGIDVKGSGNVLDPIRFHAVERLSFDIIMRALAEDGAVLVEQVVTKTLYVEDVSTEIIDISWSESLKIEVREAGKFDHISIQWVF
ncbi:MAG: hypothetical protein CME30_04645 [Gemmatimonadetes bacterium]|nr:hypothetical protein [Gemmatimonadota bacterium]